MSLPTLNLSDDQLRTLRHMLGINDPWQKVPAPYRNYYCANPNDAKLVELERLGAVERYSERDGYWWFCCTDAGRNAALASYKAIRKPQSARKYRTFLNVRDCFPDLTFLQFLTDAQFRDTRLAA